MRSLMILLAVLALATGCKPEKSKDETTADQKETERAEGELAALEFGDGVHAENVLSTKAMSETYAELQVKDTLLTSFEAEVTEVCQMKGCWMKLDLGDEGTAMVRFKDYGFFMPKDLAGKTVVVEGKAYLEMMSVEDQKHYAEDAGSSEEEVEAIDAPAKTFAFEASGVRIK